MVVKRSLRLFILPTLVLLLPSCASVTPAVQTNRIPHLKLSGLEKFAVLPLRVWGYRPEETLNTSHRISDFVEFALAREGLGVIQRPTFEKTLEQLKYQPPVDMDAASAKLLRTLTGADIVVEGVASTTTVGVLNAFKETLYALDARTGELLLLTTGEGDSDIYFQCAHDLAKKIRKAVSKTPSKP